MRGGVRVYGVVPAKCVQPRGVRAEGEGGQAEVSMSGVTSWLASAGERCCAVSAACVMCCPEIP